MPRAMRHINFVLLGTILLSGLLVGLSASGAQRASDDGIKAASQAFYAALSGTDVAAMKKVWAHTDYVVYVGPRSTAIARGWPAVEQAWDQSFAQDESRRVQLRHASMHSNATLAWEVGTETGTIKRKDGTERALDAFVTNIYEKQQGRWLMVSHHVQPKPH